MITSRFLLFFCHFVWSKHSVKTKFLTRISMRIPNPLCFTHSFYSIIFPVLSFGCFHNFLQNIFFSFLFWKNKGNKCFNCFPSLLLLLHFVWLIFGDSREEQDSVEILWRKKIDNNKLKQKTNFVIIITNRMNFPKNQTLKKKQKPYKKNIFKQNK